MVEIRISESQQLQRLLILRQLKRQHFSDLYNVWYLQLLTHSMQDMPDDLYVDLLKLRIIKMFVMDANKKSFPNLNELVSFSISISSQESVNDFDTSELKSAPNFKELILHSNKVTRLTKQFFAGCSNVERLEMRFNTIEAIDFDAFPLTNLKNIEMDYNKLSLPSNVFSENKKLEKFKIHSWNSPIPEGLLSNFTNLRDVIINDYLTSIPNNLIHGSSNVEMLDLQFNQLTSLPRDFFRNHSKLKVVKLDGNWQFLAVPDDYFYDKSPLT